MSNASLTRRCDIPFLLKQLHMLGVGPARLSAASPAEAAGAAASVLVLAFADAGNHRCLRVMLEEYAADPDASPTPCQSPLVSACSKGHLRCAELLLQAGAEVGLRVTAMKRTALMEACRNGEEECARLLLRRKHDAWCAVDMDERRALHAACESGSAGCVSLLLEHMRDDLGSAGRSDWIGITPLMVACGRGEEECVRRLVESHQLGSSLDEPDAKGRTAMHHAVRKGSHLCLRLLLRGGALADVPTRSGRRPASDAANMGHAACLRELMPALSPADVQDAMLKAAEAGHAECVRALAPACSRERLGAALQKAAKAGHASCVRELFGLGAMWTDGWSTGSDGAKEAVVEWVRARKVALVLVGTRLAMRTEREYAFLEVWTERVLRDAGERRG